MIRNRLNPRLFSPAWLCLALVLSFARWCPGAQPETPASWHAQTIGQALGYMLLFAVFGIGLAIVGYKLFDKCTPGDLHKEILENRNIAAAIVAAAVILGVCVIIAAAMIG